MPITVLLVDDSAIIRGLMRQTLSANPALSIVGAAANGAIALTMAKELQPDIIILDIQMPVMDGITALPQLIKFSPASKIIMSSTLTMRNASIGIEALALGATDYVTKPSATFGAEVDVFYRELTEKILALGKSRLRAAAEELPVSATPIPAERIKPVAKPYPVLAPGARLNPAGILALAIASSTGGPQALTSLFTQLKGHLLPIPVFITQHMPANFTTVFAEQLGKTAGRPCREGKDGEIVMPGHIYIAPGDFHMVASKDASGKTVIKINQAPPENFCRPSADPMLRSLGAMYGDSLAIVVLTGMGQDGLEGAKEAEKLGSSVIAQDEASCVVYGMPKAVVENNVCKAVVPLADLGRFLIEQIDRAAA